MRENIQQLLLLLLKQNQPLKVDDLASQLKVSNRSIRYWLDEAELLLEAYGLKIIRRPKVGVWLEGSPEDVSYLLPKIQRGAWDEKYGPEHRVLLVLREILAGPISIQKLAEDLYVSRMTVYNDLEGVANYLKGYGLKLIRGKSSGLAAEGSEAGFRRATADLLPRLSAFEGDSEGPPTTIRRVDGGTYRQLTMFFPRQDISLVEEILGMAEHQLQFRFANDAFVCLVVHIAISLERLRQGKDILMPAEQMEMVRQKDEYRVAQWIAGEVSRRLGVSIPDSETGYICLHILGSKLQQRVDPEEATDILAKLEPQTLAIAQEIIGVAEDILGFELKHDRLLLAGLALHLRPALNRLRHGLDIRNPILDMIKTNYPELINAAWGTSKVFAKHLGVEISEPEVGYIAMHLGAALERLKKRKRVLLVCSSGVGTAQLLSTRLENLFPNLEIIDVVSNYQYSQGNYPELDLVISTIPLESGDVQVIRVSPILSEQDIQVLRRYTISEGSKAVQSGLSVAGLVDSDLVSVDLDLTEQRQVIDFLVTRLEQGGYVTPGYREGVLARENLASTAVGRGVAIPHTFQEHVLESKVAVVRLQKPVDWGGEKVDLVFMLALRFSKEDKAWQMFRRFFRMVDNHQFLAGLRAAATASDFLSLLSSYREE